MTVTRYKRQAPTADAIKKAVLGVTRHKRVAEPAPVPVPAKPAKLALPADKVPARTVADLIEQHDAVVVREPMKIDKALIARAKRKTNGRASQGTGTAFQSPFRAYVPPPGTLPTGAEPEMALDSALQGWADSSFTNALNAANPAGQSFSEGIGFLGYAYLSQLTERPEFRRMSERIATEMTRKWIRLTIQGEADPESAEDDEDQLGKDKAPAKQPDRDLDEEEDDDADGAPAGGAVADDQEEDDEPTPEEKAQRKRNEALQKKLRLIEADMKRLDVRGKFKTVAEYDGWMGRSHLYIDTGEGDDADALKIDLGNGSDEKSKSLFKKGSLRNIKHIEPIWCYPVNYNANDPLSDDWYNPQLWFAMAKQLHVSRLLTFVGRPVPDILKPSYAFGGLSLSQMAKPYVDNWLRTRQAVTALIESFSVSGVYTNAQSMLQGGGEEVLDRIELFNVGRTNAGAMVLDKETEEFFNISTPLGTLDHLQAQSQEQMSSVSGIPLIVLLGITPSGLNASSEGELRVFYDLILAMQESLFRDKLHRVLCFIQLNLFGEVDPAIGFEFEPLWSLDEKGEAEVKKIEMEIHTGYIDAGVIGQEEVRNIVVADEDSPYNGLDPDDLPEPPADQGMMPPGGGGGEGGAGSDNKEVEGAADESLGAVTEVALDVFAFDEGQFDESKIKRDMDGKFATTGAGGGGASGGVGENVFKSKKEHIGHLLMKGVTPKELMQAMNWPSVSMPAQAKSLGMKLEKKDGKYFGTPMTDAEKAAAKAEAKGKETDKQAQQILKNAGLEDKPAPKAEANALEEFMSGEGGTYPKFLGAMAEALQKNDTDTAANLLKFNPAFAEQLSANMKPAMKGQMQKMGLLQDKPAKPPEPEKPKIAQATEAELQKAKKNTTLPLNLVPGEKPEISGSPQMEMAQANLKTFNEKYAGKELTDPADLNQKVHDFKQLQKSINSGGVEEAKHKAEIQAEAKKKAVEVAKKAAVEAAEKQAKEKAKLSEQHKQVREALGIEKDSAELEAFDSFIDHFGGVDNALKKFKSWESEALSEAKKNPGKGYEKLSGFEMACIKGYTGPKSGWINEAIINDSMTPAQFMFEKVLNQAIDKLPKVSGKIVKRGLTMNAATLAKMEPGKVWTHRNFASSNAEGWGGNVKLHITTSGKGGAYVGDISSHVHENETLFKSNLRLMIDKAEKKNDVLHVHCREL